MSPGKKLFPRFLTSSSTIRAAWSVGSPAHGASIIDFEVYSRLVFADDGQDTVTVSHLHADDDGILHRRDLVEITRPPEKTFISQLKHVYAYAQLRAERALEISAHTELPLVS